MLRLVIIFLLGTCAYASDRPDWTLGVDIGISGTPIDREAMLATLDVTISRHVFGVLGLQLGVTRKLGRGGSHLTRGEYENVFNGFEAYLGAPIRLSQTIELSPKVGLSNYTYKKQTQVSTSYRLPPNVSFQEHILNQHFVGGDLALRGALTDNEKLEVAFKLDARKYSDTDLFKGSLNWAIGIGIRYGF